MIGKNISDESGTVSRETYFGHFVFLLNEGAKKIQGSPPFFKWN